MDIAFYLPDLQESVVEDKRNVQTVLGFRKFTIPLELCGITFN